MLAFKKPYTTSVNALSYAPPGGLARTPLDYALRTNMKCAELTISKGGKANTPRPPPTGKGKGDTKKGNGKNAYIGNGLRSREHGAE